MCSLKTFCGAVRHCSYTSKTDLHDTVRDEASQKQLERKNAEVHNVDPAPKPAIWPPPPGKAGNLEIREALGAMTRGAKDNENGRAQENGEGREQRVVRMSKARRERVIKRRGG